MGLLPMDFDILPPSDDRVFKLILTSPDAKPVLADLISAVLGRTVSDVVVRNNELPPEDTEEKAERFDANCVLDDGTQVDLEKWAVFFQYASEPQERETVNEVIASKEALQMAGNLLMSISKDERERAVFRSRRMYQTDRASDLATAEDRGERRGVQKGHIEVAQRMLRRNRPIDEIAEDTGLSIEEIETLKNSLDD